MIVILMCLFLFGISLPVIPLGEGFGLHTPAGSGRNLNPPSTTVYKVTTLETSGDGSLYDCINADHPRICIFEISGVIEYQGWISIRYPYITIAGQTAPSPGIMFKGAGFSISTHDVLIQHIAIRTGDTPGEPDPDNRDCVDISSSSKTPHNIVLDHVSMAYSIDESFTLWYGPTNVTLMNSIISHSLHDSLHPKGPHGKGILVGPKAQNVSLIRNVMVSNQDRNPLLGGSWAEQSIPGCSYVEVINNVIYNWEWGSLVINDNFEAIGDNGDLPQFIHVVQNYFKPGPDTSNTDNNIILGRTDDPMSMKDSSRFFIYDNHGPTRPTPDVDHWANVNIRYLDEQTLRSNEELFPSNARYFETSFAYELVLKNSGSRPKERDSEDLSSIQEVIEGNGGIINCVEYSTEPRCEKNAGGYPTYSSNSRTLSIPDNPNEQNEDGYTNLEKWLFGFSRELEDYSCFGISHTDTSVCSSNGICSAPEFCDCNEGFMDADCSTVTSSLTSLRVSCSIVLIIATILIFL